MLGMVFHGIPWSSMVFHGIPRYSYLRDGYPSSILRGSPCPVPNGKPFDRSSSNRGLSVAETGTFGLFFATFFFTSRTSQDNGDYGDEATIMAINMFIL